MSYYIVHFFWYTSIAFEMVNRHILKSLLKRYLFILKNWKMNKNSGKCRCYLFLIMTKRFTACVNILFKYWLKWNVIVAIFLYLEPFFNEIWYGWYLKWRKILQLTLYNNSKETNCFMLYIDILRLISFICS